MNEPNQRETSADVGLFYQRLSKLSDKFDPRTTADVRPPTPMGILYLYLDEYLPQVVDHRVQDLLDTHIIIRPHAFTDVVE